MKKIILLALSVLLLLNCSNPKAEKNRVFYFSFYDTNSVKIENNTFVLERKKNNLFDSIVVLKKNKRVLCFKEKQVDGDGIYRYIKNKKILTHSFNDSKTLRAEYGTSFIPFINAKTTLINKVVYTIGSEKYKLFHYSETEGSHTGFDSYYLENIGFICYYNFDSDKYILCDSTNDKSLKIKEITSRLVKDKTFFARFTVAKLFPNYYRKNNNSKGI